MNNQNKLSITKELPTLLPAPISLGLQRILRNKSEPASENVPVMHLLEILLLHVPLMIVYIAVPFNATVHALLALDVGIHYLLKGKRPAQDAWVIAYIADAEILWRGANAALFWEYSKYATL